MTVDELYQRMSMDEYVTWAMYHSRIAQRRELEIQKARG